MKNLYKLAVLVLSVVVVGCGYDDSGILSRLDVLEKESKSNIATLQQQIDAINTTLPQLQETDAELKEYIESLQTTATNLQQQITATNGDIDELEAQLSTDKADILAQLESTKTALEAELNQINSTIATLQAKDTELEGKITTLEEYVNTELQNAEDWATATFATLEQYNTIVEDIATIKTQIEALNTSLTDLEERLNTKIVTDIATAVEGLQGELATKVTEITAAYTDAISTAKEEVTVAYTEAIATSIANLETSMKEWVNEQLAGYYTIAEVDAALELLSQSITDGDAVLLDEINKLSERIEAMKTTITEAYQSAIVTAITENNGVIDTKIATEIATVNSRIDSEVATINSRIDTLEGRIEALEDIVNKIQALDIVFDNTEDLVCYPGASVEVGYTIIGGDDATAIECFGDGGWSASIVKESVTTGKIKVTAPKDATLGKVIVLATSGVGGSVMKSLYFDEGVLTDILDTYEVDWEACTLNVTLKTNLDYIVNIPVDWITVADTRAALREDVLTFSIAENLLAEKRYAHIELIGECGDVLQTFVVSQYPTLVIEFEDEYAKLVCIKEFDTNGDGELSLREVECVTTIDSKFFGDYAVGIQTFTEFEYFINVSTISDYAFLGCSKLQELSVPSSVKSIGNGAFYKCSSLTKIDIPNGVTSIGYEAFYDCSLLSEITIPKTIVSIGSEAFAFCSNLKSISCKAITPPLLGDNVLYGNAEDLIIYVPMSAIEAYKKAVGWCDYADYIFLDYTEWASFTGKYWNGYNSDSEFMFQGVSADGSIEVMFDCYTYPKVTDKIAPEGEYIIAPWEAKQNYVDGDKFVMDQSTITYNSIKGNLASGTLTVKHIAGGYRVTFNFVDTHGREFYGTYEGPLTGGTMNKPE